MDIKAHFKAGGSFVELKPQFSSNSESIFVAWKNKILGYNVKTGALFAEFRGINNKIVGFGVHYYDNYECVTACSSSGELITWKIVTFFKILNKKLEKSKILTFHVIPTENSFKFLISYCEEKDIASVCLYNVIKDVYEKCGIVLNRSPFQIDFCKGNYFAITQKTALNLISHRDLYNTYTYCINGHCQFTCVACHPENEIVLTGDTLGRIIVWQKIFTFKPVKTIFHWHTLPVKCVSFSSQGSYFYSGADESVLVRWHLDNQFEKKFLPRIASTIAKISVASNNLYVAVATDDNAVRIVDSRFDHVSLIQHLVIGNNFESGITVDPKSKALVMNGNVGQIQFYSTYANSLLYNVDVVGQNRVSNERSCKINNTQVSKVAISKSGLWMATVEMRKDPQYMSELRLKFWIFDVTIQNFKLNTCIEDPHANHIHSMKFQPVKDTKDLKLVTVGDDKKFKIWYLTELEKVNSSSLIWRCLCVGFYHELPCKGLSFSFDGSLIAVSFGNIATTWVPASCELKCTLSHPVCREELTQVEFGNGNQCHLLVAASSERLSVWNLLTLTMLWSVPVNITVFVADTVTTNMAVITKKNMVFVFSPNSPQPVFTSKALLKGLRGVCSAAFVPTKFSNDGKLPWYQRSVIYVLDTRKELYCLSTEEESSDTPKEIHEIESSVFSMTVPRLQVDKSKPMEPVQHLYQKDVGQQSLKKYLEAPLQTMIPARIMCGPLLRSMVLQKPTNNC